MSSRIYTSTASFPLAVGWKCTNCGNMNAQICDIECQSSKRKTGLRHSQSLQDDVSYQAKQALEHTVLNIYLNAQKAQYTHHLNACACRSCSHKEKWATVKDVGEVIRFCLLVALCMIIPVLISEWPARGYWLGIIAVLLATCFIYPCLAAKKKKWMKLLQNWE